MLAKDLSLISFGVGAISMLLLTLIFFWVVNPSDYPNPTGWNSFFGGLDSFYFTYILIFILVGVGINIMVFRMYSINYSFIFEIDQNYKMIHH